MGQRVHVAKCYAVEWGKTGEFNWSDDKFTDILKALGAYVFDGGGSYDFEVSVEDYDDAIENLKVYISDPHLLIEIDEIAAGLNGLGMTAEELLDTMQRYREEADTHDGWLHFTSF